MIIVGSDASPIINLAAVGHLSLLQELFGSILALPAVWAEVMAGDQFALPDWLELQSPADRSPVASLTAELNRGEAEAIALEAEIAAGMVLINEKNCLPLPVDSDRGPWTFSASSRNRRPGGSLSKSNRC